MNGRHTKTFRHSEGLRRLIDTILLAVCCFGIYDPSLDIKGRESQLFRTNPFLDSRGDRKISNKKLQTNLQFLKIAFVV